ncbi:MAG: MFS transporter [Spongiibacteraceae bacterium]|jgi:MFS family permease|nr:MFS transporter [Spongiibacteraceae bacterium]
MTTASTSLAHRGQRLLLAGLLALVSLHAFDELVLAIALPSIVAELGGQAWYGVAFASYLLASLLGMRWGGLTVDRRGPAASLLVGYLVFAAGLVVAALAPDMPTLILGRVLQGFGGGVGWNVAFAVINLAWPASRRPRVIAWLDSGWVLPSLLAPLLGGYIIDQWHWRALFWLLLPVTALALLALLPRLAKLPRHGGDGQDSGTMRAVILLVISGAALGAVLVQPAGWLWLLGLPLLAALLLAARRELPAGTLRARGTPGTVIALHGLVFFAFFGAETFLPWYLISQRGLSATQTGLIFSCAAVSWCVASFVQSWLASRWTRWRSVRTGLGLILLSVVLTSLVVVHWLPLAVVYLAWGIAGFGMGLSFNALTTLAMASAAPGREGAIATAMGLAQTLGMGSAALLGGVVRNQVVAGGGDLSRAILLIWLLCVAVAVLAWRVAARASRQPDTLRLPG